MKTDTAKPAVEAAEETLFRGDDWFNPLGAGVRTRIRGFIAAEMSRGRRQTGESERKAVHLHAFPEEPVEIDSHIECN